MPSKILHWLFNTETLMGCGHDNIVEQTEHTRRCGTCGRCENYNYSGFLHHYYYAVNKKDYEERRKIDLDNYKRENNAKIEMVKSWSAKRK